MPATAFVLAAGFGTRLRPLTLDRPKPLVPVCGVPALAYSLALCAEHGFTDVVVNAHHLGEQLAAWEGVHEGCHVQVHQEEPEILGTGGGLKAVADRLAERFVVLNADVLHAFDLTALAAQVRPGGAAMVLRPSDEADRYGVVAADGTDTVVQLVALAAAPAEGEVPQDTHFTGIHALDRAALDLVPEGFACIVRSAYQSLVPQRKVGAIREDGVWLDAGDPLAYLEANLAVLRDEVTLALDPFERAAAGRRLGTAFGALPKGVRVMGPVWIGEGAVIEPGARLSHCVIGAGARVPAEARLHEVVAWDGVDVPASLSRAIVHDHGTWMERT
jgi:NDP-sugar pyrophosphorylase family protein